MQGASELEKRRASERKSCWRIGLTVGSWCWASVQTRIGPNIRHGKWVAHGWNWALGQGLTKRLKSTNN